MSSTVLQGAYHTAAWLDVCALPLISHALRTGRGLVDERLQSGESRDIWWGRDISWAVAGADALTCGAAGG
jgi:hypothetical protein